MRTTIINLRLYFIPVQTRVPLKFGPETLTTVTCSRVALTLADEKGGCAEGWGETPLSVQWVWPSSLPYAERHLALQNFCRSLAGKWAVFDTSDHPLTAGYEFQKVTLRSALAQDNGTRSPEQGMPWLAALVCNSPFDLALHDAFAKLVGRPVYDIYGPDLLHSGLDSFLEPSPGSGISFRNRFPSEFLLPSPPKQVPAWHLVGGLDPLETSDLTGTEPQDGYPVLLTDWIARDGLTCLKVKLRGNDSAWDYARLVRVGEIGLGHGVEALTADFNCTVQDPKYVNEILDRLNADRPQIFERLLYVEQPFPYELEQHRIDVHSVSSRKPLFLDESAHDWTMVRLGRELGWTGVALKTCKTQTGAILSACWAKAHGMSLMVQDLTNPMLAQISHVQLAAHVGTIKGVETNAMQFYPDASKPEEQVHPGLFRRRGGMVDLSSIHGPGFGYRLEEIRRELPEPALALG